MQENQDARLANSHYIGESRHPNPEPLMLQDGQFRREVREHLQQLSKELPPGLQMEVRKIRDFFEERARKINPEIELAPLFFIPLENVHGGQLSPGEVFGQNAEDFYTYVLLVPGMDDAELMLFAYHELDHSASLKKRALKPYDTRTSHSHISGGFIERVAAPTAGFLFEEGFVAKETDIFFHNGIKSTLPAEYKKKMELSDILEVRYPSLAFLFDDGKNVPIVPSFVESMEMLDIYSLLIGKIPDIMDDILRARLVGTWGGVAKKIDEVFGRGATQLLFSISSKTGLDEYSVIKSFLKEEIDREEAKSRLWELLVRRNRQSRIVSKSE